MVDNFIRYHFFLIAILITVVQAPATFCHANSLPFYQYVNTWGTYGTGNGQFNDLKGIAIARNDDLYVVDAWNYRIQKFDSKGTFLLSWGGVGNLDGKFYDPRSIALDSSGNVYVADNGNSRIQKFDSQGNFLLKWGTYGQDNGQFMSVAGIAVNSNGKVYVADAGSDSIQIFDDQGNFLSKWGTFGQSNGQFQSVSAIAVDHDLNVYVADIGNARIQKFDSQGNFISKFGAYGRNVGYFAEIAGIATDDANNVYVIEYGNDRVQKFNNQGDFIYQVGSFGDTNGLFFSPLSLAVDSIGNIFIADTRNNRVQEFAPVTFTITPSASIGGAINPSIIQTVLAGASASFTVTPSPNYTLANVTGCNGILNGTIYSTAAITADCLVTALFSPVNYLLNVTISGNGSGSVTSKPQGITCTSGTCSTSFAYGMVESLLPIASGNSLFSEWSGDCTGSGECIVAMNSSKSVAATFILAPKAMIDTTGYDSLNLAYSGAPSAINIATTILTLDDELPESLTMNSDKDILLKGGYNSDYNSRSGMPTRLKGVLKISKGKLTVDRLSIK